MLQSLLISLLVKQNTLSVINRVCKYSYSVCECFIYLCFQTTGCIQSGALIKTAKNMQSLRYVLGLMNINPAPNNGTEGSLYPVLRHPPAFPAVPASHPLQCLFPHLDDEYQQRANVSFSGCSCGVREYDHWSLLLWGMTTGVNRVFQSSNKIE